MFLNKHPKIGTRYVIKSFKNAETHKKIVKAKGKKVVVVLCQSLALKKYCIDIDTLINREIPKQFPGCLFLDCLKPKNQSKKTKQKVH